MIFDTVPESSQIEWGLKANFTSYLLTKYGENLLPNNAFNRAIVLYLKLIN